MAKKSPLKRGLVFGIVIAGIAFGVHHYMHGKAPADDKSPAAAAAAGGGGPAIPVSTMVMSETPVRVWTSFSGRLSPVDAAEIRPQVSGRITKVLFQDGQQVKAGQVLMIIDPGPYEAAVSKAEADLASAKTNATFAALEQKRAGAMVKTQAISQRIYDQSANENRVAEANIQAAEAALKQARINLDYAYVKSPISGRVGRDEVLVGNLVQSSPNAPLLTTVVANDAVYADFEVDEGTYLRSVRNAASDRAAERKIPVQLMLQGEDAHPYDGRIYSFDNHIDNASGTIRARAKFDNKDGALLPGMFVSVRMAGGNDQSVLLLPESAIGFDQNKQFVFVVGDDHKVAYREVKLGDSVKGQRIVLDGLSSGEHVIVDGVQHVRPGATVSEQAAGDAPAASAAAQKVAQR